jgi:hypothetical protein
MFEVGSKVVSSLDTMNNHLIRLVNTLDAILAVARDISNKLTEENKKNKIRA